MGFTRNAAHKGAAWQKVFEENGSKEQKAVPAKS